MQNEWGNENEYKILVRKREGIRSLGRPRLRYEDNIKVDLKEIGCGLDLSASGEVSSSGLLTEIWVP
jgi:hypothetical protein